MPSESLQHAVLARIAAENGIDAKRLSLGANGAVFCRRGRELLCLCQAGSHYWNELESSIIAARTIKEIMDRPT